MSTREVIDVIEEVIDYLRLIRASSEEDNGETRLMVNLMRAAVFLREGLRHEA
jgi:hypothetical protein